MESMETIVTLLVIVTLAIFKLIGKKFEQAADVVPPSPVEDAPLKPASFRQDRKSVVPSADVPVEEKCAEVHEEEKAPGEKIDVKKMIIYSEIMKPKYLDK